MAAVLILGASARRIAPSRPSLHPRRKRPMNAPLPASPPSRDDGPILLFFREPERDRLLPYDRYVKRVLRPLYHSLHKRQKTTGFAVSFRLLRTALERAGYEVRVNDHAYARAHPDHPVGLVGFPVLLDGWVLPNPALLGPSLHDHPLLAPDLMKDPRYRKHLVLADWTHDMYAPTYGADNLVSWFAGIDLDEWPDARGARKDFDVLLYDKIRWDRYVLEPRFLAKLRARLESRGLRVAELRYKHHDHATYRDLLARSRSMVFVCEHETQGIAYQEAMAMNVPVLAWDFGIWADPLWKLFSTTPIPASSVPFFSAACGERFRLLADFDEALDRFLARLDGYEPRAFVAESLSMARSAEIYANAYFGLTAGAARAESTVARRAG